MPDPSRLHGWKSLDRFAAPTSDALCRLAGTAGCRLQPIGSCRYRLGASFWRGQDGKSSPVWPGPPLPPPVKETPSTTQSAFRLVIYPRAFAREPSLYVSSVKMPRKTRAPISPSPCRRTRQRSDGFLPARSRPWRTQSFDRASSPRPYRMRADGRCTVCLAATRGSRRRMRLTDFCFPTTRLRAPASRRFP